MPGQAGKCGYSSRESAGEWSGDKTIFSLVVRSYGAGVGGVRVNASWSPDKADTKMQRNGLCSFGSNDRLCPVLG